MHTSKLRGQIDIALVGCGGTGSQILSQLARLDRALLALGFPDGLNVTVFDDDTVSEANIGRQLFLPQDVGKNKAEVLVTRVNMCFGTDWRAVPSRFESNYDTRRQVARGYSSTSRSIIIIGCVDTKKSRQAINDFCRDICEVTYWLDFGNKARDGQVVLGQPLHHSRKDWHMRLPTVVELFPEVLGEDDPDDDVPSCSLAEALEKQELFINLGVTVHGMQMLWELFRYGEIDRSAEFINLKSGRVSPLAVNRDDWKRFGHKTFRKPATRKPKT